MPQHLGFRDRLPANFGSENLRQSPIFFDDFVNGSPNEEAWSLNNFSGTGSKLIEDLPGGVFSLGESNLGLGNGTLLRTDRCFGVDGIAQAGARLIWGEDWSPASGFDIKNLGFFFGFHNVPSTSISLLFNLTGVPNNSSGFGFIRDAVTLSDDKNSFVQACYWHQDGGTQVVRQNLDVEFSAGFEQGRFYDFGVSMKDGLARLTIDDEFVHSLRPEIESGNHGVMLSHFNTRGGSSTKYPTSLAVDWTYCSSERASLKPYA